ncbi:hypothetical protein TRVL_00438 [Trypanosoma vivax]|uniref:General transcription factor IIH subunit 4 n=1 Tax=Trypanosoma vivax (strain Y486) TaxID=1055687 RepID=G0U6H0_TRYVY|nr:hypothetical protein TRVL_00438 [Trypanosoma vivax]CCC51474.1 conserved hypothetical protein [Trypanosoma vivax Y486]
MVLSYLEQILSYPERETLIATCPALALFIFQELVASLRNGKRIPDPASVHDEVSVFLSIDSMPELTERVFAPHATDAVTPLFWMTLRKALSCAWDPNPEGDTQQMLCEVNGVVRFLRTDVPCVPLAGVSLQNALSRSRNMLRMVTACALAGSLEPLGTNSEQPISVMLQFSNLIPPPPEVGVVTPEGLNFCMQPIQQQWWTLVSVALDRVLAVAATQGVLRAELWQLLAVLFALDTSEFVYPFPDREKDFAAFQLLARLSEVGLVYPLLCDGQRCFVLSPQFHHAVCWNSTAPLCTVALLDDDKGGSYRVRREDEDTIITETNFRLYAYTRNKHLLAILEQFAIKEAEVDGMIVCFRVTRASFAAALRKGIGAQHIVQFLRVKAHSSMLKHQLTCDPRDSAGLAATSSRVTPTDTPWTHADKIIPRSFCDQLFTWERECRRLTFNRALVLLRNVSSSQQELILDCLGHYGLSHAVVHRGAGSIVLKRDVYDRVFSSLLTPQQ